jgi:hypothetical protein
MCLSQMTHLATSVSLGRIQIPREHRQRSSEDNDSDIGPSVILAREINMADGSEMPAFACLKSEPNEMRRHDDRSNGQPAMR